MIKDTWFPTSIWADDINVSHLEEVCLNTQTLFPTVHNSNKGGWQSPDNIIFNREFDSLREEVLSRANIIARELHLSQSLVIDSGWININKGTDENIWHVHPGCALVCSVYIKVPTSSKRGIAFKDPRNVRLFVESAYTSSDTEETFQECRYPTPENSILFFPPWLEHAVPPSLSDESRISISMNFSLLHN
jgi:uncharacterized protein (TIGR02466 family)